jgi:hypothetical protein
MAQGRHWGDPIKSLQETVMSFVKLTTSALALAAVSATAAIKFKLPVLLPYFHTHLLLQKLLARTLISQHRLSNLVDHLQALSVFAKALVKTPSISQTPPVRLKRTNSKPALKQVFQIL